MSKKAGQEVYLIGAGGHTRSLINLVELNGLKILGIYEDNFTNGEVINSYNVLGTISAIKGDDLLILSVGDNVKRSRLFEEYRGQLYKEALIHPDSIIEKRVEMGCCNQIFAGACINSNAKLGDNNIINTRCVLEHEVIIGSGNHISVGTVICGRAQIGDRCFIGAAAVVIDKVRICDDVTVGAGAIVVKDIESPGTYVGNPARKIK
ncbi:MAG: acetyltransferase [Sedimentisphaerales bacterium]|nr:acetyltransferase [Sedimentisphaerales bacterium]